MSETHRAGPRTATVVFIFATVLLDVLALGIIVPVLPNLVKDFEGGNTASAATLVGWLGSLGAAMTFLAAPVLGALSDRFGRRPIILFSCVGLTIGYVMIALAPSLFWLFVARVVTGITSASFATASAYIADVTPPEKRAASFGMLGAAFGLGFVAGPALGGVLGGMDLRLPFWIAAALTFANFFYGLFVLPESLNKERRTPQVVWRDANPVGALTLLARHPGMLALAGVLLLYQLAHDVMPSTFVLYGGYRYEWSVSQVGFALAAIGVATAVVQGGLIRPIIKWLGERGTLMFGLGAGAVGFAIFGYAPLSAVFLAAIPIQALWGVASPAIQSIMSRRVDPSEQGRLQGAITSIRGIGGIFGPFLFTNTFRAGIEAPRPVPGAALYLAAALLVIALLLVARGSADNRGQ